MRSIYFAVCDSYLSYCCFVWAQNFSTIQWILILQKKAVRIVNFQPRNFHTSPLFKPNSILKFQDKICLENILFVSKCLNNTSPSIFKMWFSFSSDQHQQKPQVLHRVITVSAAGSWNKIQKQLKNMLLKDLSPNKIKTVVTNLYLKSY